MSIGAFLRLTVHSAKGQVKGFLTLAKCKDSWLSCRADEEKGSVAHAASEKRRWVAGAGQGDARPASKAPGGQRPLLAPPSAPSCA